MVNIGNEWDNLLADQFRSEYYRKLRAFLVDEYNRYNVYPPADCIFNALKYTPSGGSIFVSLSDDASRQPGGFPMMRIDVRDTGKGIERDELPNVFERFFQAKRAASGTGIGLALVKSFAELHHGEAKVESVLGEGADFFVILPRMQEGEVRDEEAVDTSADENALQYIDDCETGHRGNMQQLVEGQTSKPTLLIIDDNNDIRQYERTLLQDTYFVIEAADGKEGQEKATTALPDMIISDYMMPVMDGMDSSLPSSSRPEPPPRTSRSSCSPPRTWRNTAQRAMSMAQTPTSPSHSTARCSWHASTIC